MKKITALILTFVLFFSVASCKKRDIDAEISTSAMTLEISETVSEQVTETKHKTITVTEIPKLETTEKRSASAASTTKKKKTTAVSELKTTVAEIVGTISTTIKKKKKTTTLRNYFPETSSAVSTTLSTTELTTVSTTETETQTTEVESETEEDEISVYIPVQRPETTTAAKKYCTISINCAKLMENEDKLKSGKKSFVPSNGEILKTVTVEFEDGETAFDVLCRVCQTHSCADNCQYCRSSGIQLEYEYTPGFNNYYIEGIHQIYEKDCGSKSGWMYRINGIFPNYGCSEYTLEDGDKIEFIYTCDLGEDIGAEI